MCSFGILMSFLNGSLIIEDCPDLTPEKKELCLLQPSICLNTDLKTEVIDLDNGFKKRFGAAIMHLAFEGLSCSLDSS